MESIVALVPCAAYDPEEVYRAVKTGLDLLGGASRFAAPGEKILLKPNMLAGREPEAAVTTHPAVFKAAARLFMEAGALLAYGDSPGYGNPRATAKKTGLAAAAEGLGIELADFETARLVVFPEGLRQKSFPVAAGVLEADGIVSLSKMKTHQLTRITGALKNQFGCLVGFEKANFHLHFPNVHQFCTMLVDLNRLLKPRLHIMDGIVAMQGEGPASGDPVRMGVLLFSADPVALDAVFCRLIDLDPALVPTIAAGEAQGLGTSRYDKIRILGPDPADFGNPDFDVKREAVEEAATLKALAPIKNLLVRRPKIIKERCVKCGVCVGACPVPGKALNFRNEDRSEPPRYDYALCIRCYCCHEMCPHKAITVELPRLGRLITKFLKKSHRSLES